MKRLMMSVVLCGLALWAPETRAGRDFTAGRVETKLIEVPDSDYGEPLRIEVWVDGGEDAVYFPGESVRLHFRTNRDAYVLLYDLDTTGQVRRLFPRSRRDDEFVEGGVIYTIPQHRAGYRLVAGGPPGEEFVTAVASDRPLAVRWDRAGGRSFGGVSLDRMGPTSFSTWSSHGAPRSELDRVYSRLVEEPEGRDRRDHRGRGRVARDTVSFTIGDPRDCTRR